MKEIGFPEPLENGLTAIHGSVALEVSEAGWDTKYLQWKFRRYVDVAIEQKAVCHFWLHPSIRKSDLYDYVFPTLEYIANRRDRGDLDVRTMNQF